MIANLLIICGMPRSGTTLMGELMRQCPGVDVISEPPALSRFTAFSELAVQYLAWHDEIMGAESQRWRNIDEHTAQRRMDEQLISFCYAFRPNVPGQTMGEFDGSRPRIEDVETVCLKQPNAELDVLFHEQNFRTMRPKYLYCLRDPRKAYRSLLSMQWGAGTSPDAFLDVLARSLSHLGRIPDAEDRVRVINVDHFASDREARLARLPDVLRHFGLTVGIDAMKFVAEWPAVNRTKDTWDTREVAESDMMLFDIAYAARPDLRDKVAALLEQGRLAALDESGARGDDSRLAMSGIPSPPQSSPSDPVTRAELAVLLLRAKHGFGFQPPIVKEKTGTGFADVPADHWAAAWIRQCKLEGIAAGINGDRFDPERQVTRDQIAVFLLRAIHGQPATGRSWLRRLANAKSVAVTSSYLPPDVGKSTGFTDVPTTHWAAPWIKQLTAEGITVGCGNGRYCPDLVVTRSHLATFLARIGGIL